MANIDRNRLLKFRHNYAILIGINDYQVAPLRTPVADARALREVLIEQQGFEEEEVILLENPTWMQLYSFFKSLLQLDAGKAQALADRFPLHVTEVEPLPAEWQEFIDRIKDSFEDSDSRSGSESLLFYYAGHGIAGDVEGGGPVGYFMPTDGNFREPVLKENTSLLPMEIAFAGLDIIDSHHTLLVLDCCFAGAFRRIGLTRNLSMGLRPMSKQRFQRFLDNRAWQVLVSAGPSEKAADLINDQRDFSSIDTQHSPFAKALLDALSGNEEVEVKPSGKNLGDGVLTVHELFLFLFNRVQKLTEEHEDFDAQNPDLFPMTKHDGGQFIFSDPRHPANFDNWPDLKDFNPYAGLKSMDVKDGPFYFGRSQDVNTILRKLTPDDKNKTPGLLLVSGSSGSGKSSLVKAGLLPRLLANQKDEEGYDLYLMEPGNLPWCIQGYDPEKETWQKVWEAFAEEEGAEVETSLRFLPPDNPDFEPGPRDFFFLPEKKQILLIDSYETIYTELTAEQRTILEMQLNTLFDQAVQHPFIIIMTMRSDFQWQLELSPFGKKFLKPSADYYRFVRFHRLASLGLENLREALVLPATMLAYEFEKDEEGDLVDQILDDLDYVPNALPLLSYAMQTFVEKTDKKERLFKKSVYTNELKGVHGVLSSEMEKLYRSMGVMIPEGAATDDFPLTPEQEMLKKIMVRLVHLNDGAYTRRKVYRSPNLDELRFARDNTIPQRVIDLLVEKQLLISSDEDYLNPYVEMVHDSLINSWAEGKQWINDFGKDNLLLQRQLWQAVVDCKKEGKEYNQEFDNNAADEVAKNDLVAIGRVSELWENSPKLAQVLDSIINAEQVERVRPQLEAFYEELKEELTANTAEPEMEFREQNSTLRLYRELLDPRLQKETKLRLDAFILSGTSQKLLQIFLDYGDHWLNWEERQFIEESWKKRIKDILEIKRQRDEAIKAREEIRAGQEKMVKEIMAATWKSGAFLKEDDIRDAWGVKGLRAVYEKFKSNLDIPKLKAISGLSIFRKGPHADDFNLHSVSFGYYNPKFLEWCKKYALPAKNNKLIRKLTSPFYTKILQDLGRTFFLIYYYLEFNQAAKEEWTAGYLREVAQNTERFNELVDQGMLGTAPEPERRFLSQYGNYFDGLFVDDTDTKYFDLARQETNADFNPNNFVALGFWIRRSIDGTQSQFYELLYDLLDTYDRDWLVWQELEIKKDQGQLQMADWEQVIEKIWLSEVQEPDSWKFLPWMSQVMLGLSIHPNFLNRFRNLKKWRLLSPVPIYLQGPHTDDWQKSHTAFGHYNPEFVQWLIEKAIPARKNRALISITRRFYELHFQGLVQLLYLVKRYYETHPEVQEKIMLRYQAFLQEVETSRFEYKKNITWEELYEVLSPIIAENNVDQYAEHAFGFWIRREIDGTASLFRQLIVQLLEVYSPEFLEHN